MTTRRQVLAAAAASALIPSVSTASQQTPGRALLTADVEADIAPRALSLVRGRPPKGLEGVLFRNGPAKFRRGGTAAHWFDGDGLIRRFAILDGQAALSARFVDTPKRRREIAANRMLMPGFGSAGDPQAGLTGPDDVNAANTSVMMAGGELWALWEGGSPTVIDPSSLETRGVKTFGDDLKSMPFLAHPHVEPTGRVWNLGMSMTGRAIVWRLSANGALEAADMIALPRASYVHDFTATANHLVILLQPWIVENPRPPMTENLAWKPRLGCQILVIDKADLSKPRVFETDAFFFFHAGEAWEETDGTIRFDICAYPDPSFAIEGARQIVTGAAVAGSATDLAMIALHPDGRTVMTRTGIAAEFPKADARRAGLPRSQTIHTADNGVGVYDWKAQKSTVHVFGEHQRTEEFLFVPRPGGSGETEGWLIGPSLNLAAGATELHVMDAADVQNGPVCTWRADVALPIGFHGTFRQT